MALYRLKKPKGEYLEKMEMVQMLECFLDIFNISGFRFSPGKHTPELQEFVDKYPHLIEKID